MKSARSPIRNFASLSVGQAVAAVAALVTNIWLARVLGPEGLGLLGFGTAVVAYLTLFTGCGSELWSARMIASRKSSISVISSRIFGMRLWALVGVTVVFFALLPLLAPDPDDRQVLLFQAGVVLVVPLALDYLYQGVERQTTTAVRLGGQALLVMLLTVFLVQAAGDVLFAATAQAVGAIAPALIVLLVAASRYPIVAPDFSPRKAFKTFKRVSPFTVSAFVITLFVTVDIVMLGLLSGKTETGYYVAGFRLMLIAQIPAGLIFSVAYPKLASSIQGRRLANLELYAVILGLIAVAGSAVALATAPVLIETVYGDSFLPAVPILYVQMLSVVILHASMAPAGGLSSWGRQKDHARASAIAAAFNVTLNLALIPAFGGIGAAVATLISQIILFALFSRYLKRAFGYLVLGRQALCMLCGLAALAVSWGLGTIVSGLPLLVAATMMSCLTVLICARLFGLFRWSEVRSMIAKPVTE